MLGRIGVGLLVAQAQEYDERGERNADAHFMRAAADLGNDAQHVRVDEIVHRKDQNGAGQQQTKIRVLFQKRRRARNVGGLHVGPLLWRKDDRGHGKTDVRRRVDPEQRVRFPFREEAHPVAEHGENCGRDPAPERVIDPFAPIHIRHPDRVAKRLDRQRDRRKRAEQHGDEHGQVRREAEQQRKRDRERRAAAQFGLQRKPVRPVGKGGKQRLQQQRSRIRACQNQPDLRHGKPVRSQIPFGKRIHKAGGNPIESL